MSDRYDLERDEKRGGHTLARHVGRSDADLGERLRRERQISAASTYTDRATAERVVALALAQQRVLCAHQLSGAVALTGRPGRGRTRRQPAAPAQELRANEFPALVSFVRGYLHEDFPEVHGSVRAAAAAYCSDATEDERRQLADELQALLRIATSRSLRDLRRFVTRDLASRLELASRDELADLLDLVRMAI